MKASFNLLSPHEIIYIKKHLSRNESKLMAVGGKSMDYKFSMESRIKLEIRTPTAREGKSFVIGSDDIISRDAEAPIEQHVWEIW